MKQLYITLITILIITQGCKEKMKTTTVSLRNLSESVYASGSVETENQYQVYSTVNGILTNIFINEGDHVNINTTLFQISNDQNKIQVESALLTSENNSFKNNKNKLEEAKLNLRSLKLKWRNDSLLFVRKQNLFNKNVITSVELENAELLYQNSLSSYKSTILQYEDLIKQLNYNAKISKKNEEQIQKNNKDFTLKSEIEGEVYTILKKKGELITPQSPIAILGSNNNYIIKLQIDEYDIVKIKKNQKTYITLDSYKGKVFEAVITKIYPIMNERSKTFTVDAKFINNPPTLYPNLSVEANIVIKEFKNALTIPRTYLKNNTVLLEDGTIKKVKTGLKNYEYVQIIHGLNANDKIAISNEN
jgi:HlyD family secretion protein